MFKIFIYTTIAIGVLLVILISWKPKKYKRKTTNKHIFKGNNVVAGIVDWYELQGIKLPNDIIMDIESVDFKDEGDCIAWIESQRYNWKQENSKKILK